MEKPVHGKIFAVPLPDGSYIFGRIMLDIPRCVPRRLFPHDSPVVGLGGYLVEMYSAVRSTAEYTPSSVLIPGAFLLAVPGELTPVEQNFWEPWQVVGERSVNPRFVEFPEYLVGFDHPKGRSAFQCGEISIPVPLADPSAARTRSPPSSIGVLGCLHSPFMWPYVCLWALGRRSEIPTNYKVATLEGSDLRFSRFRTRVYEHLPFKMEQSYFEKQAQLGLNFERLYE